MSELGLAVSLHSWQTEQRTAQDYSPHLFQTWAQAWDDLCLTCAGFSLLMVQAHHCRICSTEANIWSDESHTGKAPANAGGPKSMTCTLEGLVTGLFPTEMFRLTSSLMGFRLPGHGGQSICSASHGRLMYLGKRLKDLSLLFWFLVPLQIPSKQCPGSVGLILAMGSLPENKYKMFPWKLPDNTPSAALEFCVFAMLFIQNSLWWN